MIKNKLLLGFFSILMTIFGTYYAEGSVAAEPHGDEHLYKYAEKPEFEASIPFSDDCSASRIEISRDDPIDFYATAAHCLKKYPVSPTHKMLNEAFKEIKKTLQTNSSNEVPFKEILERHLSLLTDNDIKSHIGANAPSKAELISVTEQQLKETSVDNLLIIYQAEIDYIEHPKYDFAIFTTNQQSNQPKYLLYRKHLNDLLHKEVVNVGFGVRMASEESDESKKRQAFDSTIGSIGCYNLYSTIFEPDTNRTLEDPPVGTATGGDSGGTLLIKEEDGYKFVGVTKGRLATNHEPFHSLSSSLLFLYETIPASLKGNFLNQYCVQKLQDPDFDGDLGIPCYGVFTRWVGIDLKFMEEAKKNLLAKRPVYAYSTATKTGDFPITFSLKNGLNENRLEDGEGLIGYASRYAKLVVLVDGKEIIAFPFQLGYKRFICQSADKHYPIAVTVEEAIDGKAFFVKANVLKEEKDQCEAHNLINGLTIGKEECNAILSFAKPVYNMLTHAYVTGDQLPLKISLDNSLSNENLFKENFDSDPIIKNEEILGYAGDTYDVVIKLDGQEIKRFSNKEILWKDASFNYQYFNENYSVDMRIFENILPKCILLTTTIKKAAKSKAGSPIHLAVDSNENEDNKFTRAPVKYFFSDRSKMIAQDLGLTVDLIDAIAESEEDDQVGFKSIGYGNPNSVARILFMGYELTRFELKDLSNTLRIPQAGKNGESYVIMSSVFFNQGAFSINLDIQEVEKDEL